MSSVATLEKSAATQSQQPAQMKVAVTSAKAPDYVEGRRNFFKNRDLGVTRASDGWMRAQVMQAVTGMTQPTGSALPCLRGAVRYALKGFVELEFEDGTQCRLEAGDRCFIPAAWSQPVAHLG